MKTYLKLLANNTAVMKNPGDRFGCSGKSEKDKMVASFESMRVGGAISSEREIVGGKEE